MDVILAEVSAGSCGIIDDTPPCHAPDSGYDPEVPTGVYNAIDKFLKEEK
jgi:hypothetical protein